MEAGELPAKRSISVCLRVAGIRLSRPGQNRGGGRGTAAARRAFLASVNGGLRIAKPDPFNKSGLTGLRIKSSATASFG